MAHPKMIGAIIVALLAIGLEGKKRDTWLEILKIGDTLGNEMSENLSTQDQADAEKVFSFAKQYINGMEKKYAEAGQELVTAWDAVLHHPDQCNEFSLGYVARINECNPWHFSSMTSLTEATRKYASKCLTPSYIANKIESESSNSGSSSGCFSTSCLIKTKEFKFIDDQLIADYWSDNPWGRPSFFIDGLKSAKAAAKAVLRDPKRNIKDIKNRDGVNDYLKEHLYKPCKHFERSLKRVMGDLIGASLFLEGRYEKLIPSLDKNIQNVIFRYKLCQAICVFDQGNEITSQVMSELESLNSS